MCGRYASFRSAQDLADAFDVEDITAAAAAVEASYNVAPTDAVRVVVDRAERNAEPDADLVRQLHTARWGLVPSWAKDPSIGARMINARSESVADKPAFAPSLAKRRCLVVADGYFEWHKGERDGKPYKTPYYIYRTDGAPIAFAGLYAWWPDPDKPSDDPDRWLLSTAIITQAARDGLEELHDREPAVLDSGVMSAWLGPDGADEALEILSQPAPALSWHEVDRAVGSVRNQGSHLIARI